MLVVAKHRIQDPEQFFSRTPEVAQNAPSGVRLLQALPSTDRTEAVCLWEADSVDAVRDYVDSQAEGIAQNDYFEIDASQALGLPQGAGANA